MNRKICEDALDKRMIEMNNVLGGDEASKKFEAKYYCFAHHLRTDMENGTADFLKIAMEYHDCIEAVKADIEERAKPFLEKLALVEEAYRECQKYPKEEKKTEW